MHHSWVYMSPSWEICGLHGSRGRPTAGGWRGTGRFSKRQWRKPLAPADCRCRRHRHRPRPKPHRWYRAPRFFLLGAEQVPEALAPSGLYRWRSVNPQGKSGPSRVDLRSESRRRSDLTNWLSEGPSARAHDGREVRGGAHRHAPCGPSFSA